MNIHDEITLEYDRIMRFNKATKAIRDLPFVTKLTTHERQDNTVIGTLLGNIKTSQRKFIHFIERKERKKRERK